MQWKGAKDRDSENRRIGSSFYIRKDTKKVSSGHFIWLKKSKQTNKKNTHKTLSM